MTSLPSDSSDFSGPSIIRGTEIGKLFLQYFKKNNISFPKYGEFITIDRSPMAIKDQIIGVFMALIELMKKKLSCIDERIICDILNIEELPLKCHSREDIKILSKLIYVLIQVALNKNAEFISLNVSKRDLFETFVNIEKKRIEDSSYPTAFGINHLIFMSEMSGLAKLLAKVLTKCKQLIDTKEGLSIFNIIKFTPENKSYCEKLYENIFASLSYGFSTIELKSVGEKIKLFEEPKTPLIIRPSIKQKKSEEDSGPYW